MKQNIRIAKELVKIAKSLIAEQNIANQEGEYKNFTGIISLGSIEGKVINATFELKEKPCCIIWKTGIWEDGRFFGEWENGTWKNGDFDGWIWENGTWENGYFNGQTWENGTWKNGNFYGTWKNGTWKNGAWKGGTWKNGTWENGIWQCGLWMNGTWKNGTWKYIPVDRNTAGYWQNGTWKNGTWEGGFDNKNGVFHEADDSPDKWDNREKMILPNAYYF